MELAPCNCLPAADLMTAHNPRSATGGCLGRWMVGAPAAGRAGLVRGRGTPADLKCTHPI